MRVRQHLRAGLGIGSPARVAGGKKVDIVGAVHGIDGVAAMVGRRRFLQAGLGQPAGQHLQPIRIFDGRAELAEQHDLLGTVLELTL